MEFVKNDGGRAAAGYKGDAGDCVTRAIAIATGKPYKEVYDRIHAMTAEYAEKRRTKVARAIKRKGTSSPRDGVFRDVYDQYLKDLGWEFIPTMSFGSGCTTHLKADELPAGIIITRLSRHLCAVIDGIIHDTHNPSRGGTRCVYGYYAKNI